MLVILGVGAVLVIVVTIDALKLTMREEPSGCLLAFGSVFLLFLLALTVMLWP